MRNERGFTLVELLVVIAIIGTLAAIAVPEFAKYRVSSYNSLAQADARTAVTAQESIFAGYETYTSGSFLPSLKLSPGVGLYSLCNSGGDNECAYNFYVATCHVKGRKIFQYTAVTGWYEYDRGNVPCVEGVHDTMLLN